MLRCVREHGPPFLTNKGPGQKLGGERKIIMTRAETPSADTISPPSRLVLLPTDRGSACGVAVLCDARCQCGHSVRMFLIRNIRKWSPFHGKERLNPRTCISDGRGSRGSLAGGQTPGRPLLPSGPLVLVPNSVPRPQKGRAPDVGGTAYRLHCPPSSLNTLACAPGRGSHKHRGQHGCRRVLRTVWSRGRSAQEARALFLRAEAGVGTGAWPAS